MFFNNFVFSVPKSGIPQNLILKNNFFCLFVLHKRTKHCVKKRKYRNFEFLKTKLNPKARKYYSVLFSFLRTNQTLCICRTTPTQSIFWVLLKGFSSGYVTTAGRLLVKRLKCFKKISFFLVQNASLLFVACGRGLFKLEVGNNPCERCPAYSHSRGYGSTACECMFGYFRATSDEPTLPCTSEFGATALFLIVTERTLFARFYNSAFLVPLSPRPLFWLRFLLVLFSVADFRFRFWILLWSLFLFESKTKKVKKKEPCKVDNSKAATQAAALFH